MAIPDEVAQYAEGHRIVSYFSLANVQADGETKHTWLWTTVRGSGEPYDFDSFRVFVWSLRHRRYETAYVLHEVEGYQPVLLKEVEYGGKGVASGKYPGFSVCFVNRDGAKVRQEYALIGNIVRFAGETPWRLRLLRLRRRGRRRCPVRRRRRFHRKSPACGSG